MKRLRPEGRGPTALLTLAALLALALLAAVLPGCGGVDSGGTGQTVENVPTTTSGRISGFGSIIVNGVRFDDEQAAVVDEDGTPRSTADLALGMVVEVEGAVRGNSGRGVADRIQFGHEIAGPVASVNVAGSTLVVLGQTVRVDADTFYGGYPTGLAGVHAGHLVEVHGFYDPVSATYTASRIARATTLAHYTLRGRVAAHMGPPTRSFSIGGAAIDYGSARPPVPPLSNGQFVRVTLETVPVSGRWIATSVRASQRSLPPERDDARLEGHVSGYAGPASFLVGGVPVDASSPDLRLRHGTLADLADGVRVEVDGRMRAGVLIASELKFRHGGQQEFELNGTVESVNPGAQTLVLRGITVSWDGSTRFMAGNAGQLAPGVRLEVKGTPTGGAGILARSIRFQR